MKKPPSNAMVRRWIFVSALVLVILVIDQLTKVEARQFLAEAGRREYLGGFFAFDFAENPGAFLSVGSGLNQTFRFLIFSVGVICVLIWAAAVIVRKVDLKKWEVWGLALLLGGGLGNLIDRLAKGMVTDFMQMGVGPLRTGIFNVADIAIMAGVLILFITSFKTKKSQEA